MGYDYKYIQTIRDSLTPESRQKFSNLAVVLRDVGYPHIVSDVDMDSISADNFIGLKTKLTAFAKKLKALVSGTKPVDGKFVLHKTFKDVKNKDIVYIPLTMEFDDGQTLTALARHYGKNLGNKLQRNEYIKITRWYLNEQDITPLVYKTREDIKDEAKAIRNIASIVSFNSARFKKENLNIDEEIARISEQLKKIDEEIASYQQMLDEESGDKSGDGKDKEGQNENIDSKISENDNKESGDSGNKESSKSTNKKPAGDNKEKSRPDENVNNKPKKDKKKGKKQVKNKEEKSESNKSKSFDKEISELKSIGDVYELMDKFGNVLKKIDALPDDEKSKYDDSVEEISQLINKKLEEL